MANAYGMDGAHGARHVTEAGIDIMSWRVRGSTLLPLDLKKNNPDARFSRLYFCHSLNRLQRGLSAIAELLVIIIIN